AGERGSDGDGLRMLALAQHDRRHGFRLRDMPLDTSVLIEDLTFNSFLVVANRALVTRAQEIGGTIDADLTASMTRTEAALEELWDDESGQYYSRDAVTKELLAI